MWPKQDVYVSISLSSELGNVKVHKARRYNAHNYKMLEHLLAVQYGPLWTKVDDEKLVTGCWQSEICWCRKHKPSLRDIGLRKALWDGRLQRACSLQAGTLKGWGLLPVTASTKTSTVYKPRWMRQGIIVTTCSSFIQTEVSKEQIKGHFPYFLCHVRM